MFVLNRLVEENYDVKVKSLAPYKNGMLINSDKGKLLFKKSLVSSSRLLFSHFAKKHLENNGFNNAEMYVCTSNGLPYVQAEDECYYLCEHIEGKESNFDFEADILIATNLLANMHIASKGFTGCSEAKINNSLGLLPFEYSKKLDELRKLRKTAKKVNGKFDILFLQNVDWFLENGSNSLSILEGSFYNKLVDECRSTGNICHNDYAHHNIIFGENFYKILNFEFCNIELKAYDVANLIRRCMRKCDWDVGRALKILDVYNSAISITTEEMQVLKAILLFPQKFWRVVNRYYNSKRSWSETSYISKLEEVLLEKDVHRVLINEIK